MSALRDSIAKAVNVVHRTLYDVTDGKVGGKVAGMTVLELTTTGAKSGKDRTVMLTAPVISDGNPVIVASYGGDDRSPAWFHNLKANPVVTVKIDGETKTMRARITEGDERDRLFAEIGTKVDNYTNYQTKTDRVIPVGVLES